MRAYQTTNRLPVFRSSPFPFILWKVDRGCRHEPKRIRLQNAVKPWETSVLPALSRAVPPVLSRCLYTPTVDSKNAAGVVDASGGHKGSNFF